MLLGSITEDGLLAAVVALTIFVMSIIFSSILLFILKPLWARIRQLERDAINAKKDHQATIDSIQDFLHDDAEKAWEHREKSMTHILKLEGRIAVLESRITQIEAKVT